VENKSEEFGSAKYRLLENRYLALWFQFKKKPHFVRE